MHPRPPLSALFLLVAAIPGMAGCGDDAAPNPTPSLTPAAPQAPTGPTATQSTPNAASSKPSTTSPTPSPPALPATRATKSGRFFSVELHADLGAGTARDAARAAADALAAAELAGDRFAELTGETPGRLGLAFTPDRGGRVILHVWPDTATATAAAAATAAPAPRDTHVANKAETTGTVRPPSPWSLHVAITPSLPPMAFDEVGLPSQTIRAIARAAAPMLRSRRFPDEVPPPAWIADGEADDLASYVADSIWAAARARGAKPGTSARPVEPDPWDSATMLVVSRLLESRELPSASDVMAGRTAALSGADRVAVNASLYATVVAALGDRPRSGVLPPTPATASTAPDVSALLSPAGSADLDHVWRERVATTRPGWDCPTRTLSRLPGDRDWLQVGGPEADGPQSIAWRVGDDRDTSLAVSGQVSMLSGSRSGSVARVLVGRREDGCLAVEFGPGTLALVRCDAASRTIQTLAATDREVLRPGRTIEFEVVVIQGRVAVFVDGTETLTKDVDPASVAGAWGLGVTNGSAAAWRGLSSGR